MIDDDYMRMAEGGDAADSQEVIGIDMNK